MLREKGEVISTIGSIRERRRPCMGETTREQNINVLWMF